jgi:hypothetical protein
LPRGKEFPIGYKRAIYNLQPDTEISRNMQCNDNQAAHKRKEEGGRNNLLFLKFSCLMVDLDDVGLLVGQMLYIW